MKLAIFNTHSPQDSFACELTSPGCTLGRGPDNTIILADPMARISLIQAIIKIQQDSLSISNMGQQTIFINSEALSFTKEKHLQHEDQIRIGHYLILCDFATDSPMMTKKQADSWGELGLGAAATSTLYTGHDIPPQKTEIHSKQQPPPLTVMPMSAEEAHHPTAQQSTPALSTTVLPMSHEDTTSSMSNNSLPVQKVDSTDTDITTVVDITHEKTPSIAVVTDLPENLQESKIATTSDFAITDEQLVATPESPLKTSDIHQEKPPIDEPINAQSPENGGKPAPPSEVIVEPFDDPFADFFSGPGVIPIGAEVDLHQINPFEMESAATRNSANPLEQIEAQGIQDASIQGEILSVFKQDGTEQDKRTIFTDATPTTACQDDPTSQKKEEDLLDILHTLSFEEAMRR